MLSPDYLDNLPRVMIELYSQVERDILADMARRIAAYDYWIPSAEHQRQKLREMGLAQQEILDRLSKLTGKSKAELERLMNEACNDALESDREYYRQYGIDAPDEMSKALWRILKTGYLQTSQLFKNLTKTTDSAGQAQFVDALDRAWLQINSGAFDYNTAIRNAIKDVARQGLQAIRYPSGHADTLEVAVRRAVVTGVSQTAGKMQLQLADELGCDLVETTAHAGARPEHAVWQGKVFSLSGKDKRYPDFVSSTGYGTGAGLLGWNCRHNFNPYVDGAPRAYTDEMLEQYSAKTIRYNGKMYTEYEATQMQRYHERQIRRWKRENVSMQAAGLDTTESAVKIKSWQERQKDFLKQTGLKRQSAREQIAGFGKSESRKATATVKKAFASGGRSGIMRSNRKLRDLDDMLIDITQESIDAVPLVEIPGWNASMNKKLQEAHKRLLKEAMSAETGTEFASVHRMDMSQVGKIIHGSTVGKSVHIPDQSFDYIALHNHPSGTVFSHTDVIHFLERGKLAALTAVGNDGSVYVINKTGEYSATKAGEVLSRYAGRISEHINDKNMNGYISQMYSMLEEMSGCGVDFIKR